MCLYVSAIFAQNQTVLSFYACVSKGKHKRREYKNERQKMPFLACNIKLEQVYCTVLPLNRQGHWSYLHKSGFLIIDKLSFFFVDDVFQEER